MSQCLMDHMPLRTELNTYLCSYCNGMFRAPAGSIDRTREVRCLSCALATPAAWDEEDVIARLKGMTG
jgi:DNA-directed RNA polymerase subunit RPC12/RpoP